MISRNKNRVVVSAMFILVTIFSVPHVATACDLPAKGQVFNASSVEDGSFSVNLSTAFSSDQIIQIESKATACSSLISSRISDYQDKISSLIRDKASIEGFRNIKDQISRIKTLEEEKTSIKETLGKDLSQVAMKGLYAVILETPLKTPKDELIDTAKKILSPKAVADLRGVAINSASLVEGSRLIFLLLRCQYR